MATEQPMSIAKTYYSGLAKKLIKPMEKAVMSLFREKITSLVREYESRVNSRALSANKRGTAQGLRTNISDELQNVLFDIEYLLRGGETDFRKVFTPKRMRSLAKEMVNKTVYKERQEIIIQIAEATGETLQAVKGIDLLKDDKALLDFVEQSIQENVELIKSISEQHFSKVRETIYDGLEKGEGIKALGKRISEIGDVTERRGQFIARDQLGKIYGGATKFRQQSIGIQQFKWQTSRDERVRDAHAELEGKIFGWDEGADGLFPGYDFNCRCTAKGYMGDDDWLQWFRDIEPGGVM
jgi:SPP1 gp7 family putative phage head morphogenesis protein